MKDFPPETLRRTLCIVGLLLTLSACTEAPPPVVDTSPLPPLGGGLIDSTRLVCEPAVHPNDVYGNIAAVVAGAGQRLAWADFGADEVMLQDNAATFRTAGRAGTMDGGLTLIGGLGWLNDSLWVSDLRQHRVQFFTDQGKFSSSRPLGEGALIWIPTADGRFVGLASVPEGKSVVALVAARTGKERTDTLATFESAITEMLKLPLPDGTTTQVVHPFAARTRIARSDDASRWCAAIPKGSQDIELRCVNDHGQSLMDTVLTFSPRPIPGAEYDANTSRLMTTLGIDFVALLQAMPPTSPLPVVNAMRVDSRGDIWLNRAGATESVGVWVRVRRDGAIRDTLLLPARLAPRGLRNDTIWTADVSKDHQEPVVVRCVVRE